MSDDRSRDVRYWLLTGEVPAGPFSVAELHASLASGKATWQTLACPVGGGAWVPLLRMPGFGPSASEERAAPAAGESDSPSPVIRNEPIWPAPAPDAAAVAAAAVVAPASAPAPAYTYPMAHAAPTATPPEPSAPAPATSGFEIAAGLAVIAAILFGVVAAGYGLYEWIRPLSATEVCHKFDEAKTAADTKKFATPRMHPLIDFLYAQKSPNDPNDAFEWTQEVDGPRADTKLVGFRGSTFDAEAGKRVNLEGCFLMVRADGWKVDDFIITGFEGVSLPAPFSFVDDLRRSTAPAGAPGSPKPAPTDNSTKQTLTAATLAANNLKNKTWFQNLPAGGKKGVVGGIGVGILAVVGGVWNWARGKSKA